MVLCSPEKFSKKKIWLLSNFFAITVFITKSDKTSHAVFAPFWKYLLQSVTERERFANFKMIITKCDKKLLQSVTGITKWNKIDYKVWQVIQSATDVITKCDRY